MGISTRKDRVVGHSDNAPIYWQAFRAQVFTFLNMGYKCLNVAELKDADEPDITGALARVLDEIIDKPTSPSWVRFLAVHDDPPIHSSSRHGKRRPRSDLRIDKTGGHGLRPRYTFEAKRLCRKNKIGDRQYLGKDGIGMFTNGIYALNAFEAGMLGYIQDGSVADWASKIEKRLGKDSTLTRDGQWTRKGVIAELESYHSRHERQAIGTPITIFHILLLFQ